MPLLYRHICDLLQNLDDESRKQKQKQTPAKTIIETWFRKHRSRLDKSDNDASAILSTLLPQRRTDRVYRIQAPTLESIFGKALLLGSSRVQELRRHKTPGSGVDLADCIESILLRTPNPSDGSNEPTVKEIDDVLNSIAAASIFSSPSVRAQSRSSEGRNESVANIYRRLTPRDAKWFTRLVLKNYQRVVMDERLIFRCYHPLLPQIMKIRDDFSSAVAFLQHVTRSPQDHSAIASIFRPSLGTKVGRQPWLKGRSIKHCLDMGGAREMSCELKMDGEYCQIHIDLRKPHSPIQIFSKSGKDSTADRKGLHQQIRDSLRLGTPDCPIQTGCILEGELVVFSDENNKVLPFYEIRKHVTRSGIPIGTSRDSPPRVDEHLMIVYYDVLMIDKESLLATRQSERFRRLSELIECRQGYAELVQRETISFARPSAALKLREAFARCIVSRAEGLVLKPNEPYFDFGGTAQRSFGCFNIKLKKEYLQGWGDVGDFAAVGASYDAAKAKEYKIPKIKIKWTHFFIGCLDNKEKAKEGIEKPRFVITNVVELSEDLLEILMTQRFTSPVSFDKNRSLILDFDREAVDKQPTVVFEDPLVFDMRCFSFDKRQNTTFWSMRFPSVSKIHNDRTYWDTITFDELQELAAKATETPDEEDSQEMRQWISALEKADPGGRAVDALTQESSSTETRASPTSSRIEYAQRSPHSNATRKRPAPDMEVYANKTQRLSNTTQAHPDPANRLTAVLSPVRIRQPLSQIDANPRARVPSCSLSSSDTTQQSTSNDCYSSFGSSGVIVDETTPPSSSTGECGVSKQHGATHRCSLAGKKCRLHGYSILLAPCIAHYPWLTEDLFGKHGIDDFLVDPNSWSQIAMPRYAERWDSSSRQMKKVRIRKICLVESRRLDATMSFYGKIEAAGLARKNGEREWVGVYDWRLIQDLSDLESGKQKPGEMDPWKKHHVGIA
ncbi:hypothetical protein M426DRAFT_8373 [Hypoxylon sp. CI-4A]|nr:hypothetical protein M426DRAFT_8373 [Hypoxylon sp. CI-4A]